MKRTIKPVLILLLIGTFISAQQVSSEELRPSGGGPPQPEFGVGARSIRAGECIDSGEHQLDLGALARAGAGTSLPRGSLAALNADTLETFDIELEKKKEGNIYKEIAAFVIIAAMVGYIVVTLLNPGEEEETPDSGGKELPTASLGITVPIIP